MALSSKNIINWDDIKNLFNKANAERNRFNYSTVSGYGSNPGVTKSEKIQELTTLINELGEVSFIGSVASTTPPSKGDVMYPLSTINTVLDNIAEI